MSWAAGCGHRHSPFSSLSIFEKSSSVRCDPGMNAANDDNKRL